MADQDDSATTILRRLAAEMRELRTDLKDLSKQVIEIKVAVATKPGRAELWAVMVSW